MKREDGENVKEMRGRLSRKKKSYPNKFQNKWLIRFSPWLSRCRDTDVGAFCKICRTKIAGSVTMLERHKRTKKHINKCIKSGAEQMEFDGESQSYDDSKEKNELCHEKAHFLSVNDEENIDIIAKEIDQHYNDSLSTLTTSDLDRQGNVRVDGKPSSFGKIENKYDSHERAHFLSQNDEDSLCGSIEESDQHYSDTFSPSSNVPSRNRNVIIKDKRVDYMHFLEELTSNLQQEDEYDLFAKSIASQLRKLPEDSALSLIAEIQNLVSQRRLRHLNENRTQEHSIPPQSITVSYENPHFNT